MLLKWRVWPELQLPLPNLQIISFSFQQNWLWSILTLQYIKSAAHASAKERERVIPVQCTIFLFHRAKIRHPPPCLLREKKVRTQTNYHNYKINFDVCFIALTRARACVLCFFFGYGLCCAKVMRRQSQTKS